MAEAGLGGLCHDPASFLPLFLEPTLGWAPLPPAFLTGSCY